MKLNLRFETSSRSKTRVKTNSISCNSTFSEMPEFHESPTSITLKAAKPGWFFLFIIFFSLLGLQSNAQVKLVQWSGLDVANYDPTPTIVLGGLKAWDMRMSSGWYEASPSRQSVNFTDNYMDKATTRRGQRNYWVLADKTDGAGAAYNDSNFVEYKVQAVGSSFNVGLVQLSAIFNGVAGDEGGRMAVYYSIDNDTLSFGSPMNLGTASLAMHDGTTTNTGTSIANPVHLQSAGTISQTRITSHAGDYSFTPNIVLNDGQTLTIRVYAWSDNPSSGSINKALAIRNVVISNNTPWPSQQLSPTVASVVTPTSASMSSEVTTDGGYTVTQTGFSYVTDALFVRYTPGVNDREGIITGSSNTGLFTGTFTGLKPATTYWARSYANTENGTSYGKIVQFTTPDSITAKPTVTTTAATNIGAAAATSGGNITNNGGGQIVTSGILYSKTLMDAASLVRGAGADSIIGTATSGSFVSDITGLQAGTTYYVRAFAANSDSTGYGAVLSFTTKLVDIVTTTPGNISSTKATSGGTITPNGGGTIDSSGVVVSTLQNPTLATPGAKITKENVQSGTYVSNISGLTAATTYYVRAYAAIGANVTYGDQKSFTTSVAPKLVQWSGLNVSNYMPEPTIVLGGLKAWNMRMSTGWYEASPSRQSINFTDNYMDKATTIRGQRNYWVLADKTDGAGGAYNDSNFVEYKVQAVGGAFNVGRVQLSAVFNGVAGDEGGRMAVYYSIDNDTLSFGNPMNLGTASLAMHDGTTTTTGTSIANPVHLQSAGTIAQTRITSHAGDYSFTPNLVLNDGQTLTIRVYAWSDNPSSGSINKALAIRNVVISNGTPWPSQQLSPTVASVVTPTSASMSSSIVTDGGYTVTQTGFSYVTDALFVRYTPGVNDREGIVTGSSNTGTFTGTFTGLQPATTYWSRSYANTENGTSYGKIVQFTTPDSITAKPTVTTTAATNIGAAAATSGGNVTGNGGGQIVTSGLLYSKTLMDAASLVRGAGDSIITASPAIGTFVSELSGLEANTTYYIRAFAANSDSTGYGAVLSFTTKRVDIVTTTPSNISSTKATTGGTITPNGGGTITQSGVIVSTIQNPTLLTGGVIKTNEDATTGTYVSNLTGLTANTTYYVRAYVIIAGDTVYASQKSFTTSVAPKLVQWSGLNVSNYMPEPTIVLGGLKAWNMRMSTGWYEASPSRQSINFTDNYMDKATTIRGQRNYWVLADKTDGAGAAYNDSNFVEYKVQAVGSAFNVGRVQLSAVFNGVAGDEGGRMAVYYSIDNDTLSFGNPMNLGTASLAMHDGTTTTTGTSIADPVHLQSAGTIAQTRITSHAGDYSFTPNLVLNDGQTLTIRVYAWSDNPSSGSINKALAIRNVVISNGTPWPSQQLSPTVASVVTPTSASMSSSIVTDGGYTVTQTGFSYVTDALFVRYTPGVNDREGIVTGSSNTGTFTGTFTGLQPATTYWSRSYANTENGTSYGKIVSFTTPDSITAKPTVTTAAVTNLGAAAATSGGNITNNGGGQIIASGIIYSTTLTDAASLVLGAGAAQTSANVSLGAFVSQMSNLMANTTYYVRAYASNGDSTGYGAVLSFTTKKVDIATLPATSVSATTATTGGTIITNPINGGVITGSGVIYSTIQNPTFATPGVMSTAENATSGDYTSNLTGLSPNTTYYVRAYVIIGGDTVYANQTSFTTEQSLPVTLLSFKGRNAADGNILEWTTTREFNLKGFELERSTANTGFAAVSGLINAGASTYSFTDKNVRNEVYYYRLKMIDNDGQIKYSNIVILSVNAAGIVTIRVYPNPTTGRINVIHREAVAGSRVSVLSVNGKVYQSNALEVGNTQTTLDVSNLAAGVYFIVVNESDKKSVIKFIKK